MTARKPIPEQLCSVSLRERFELTRGSLAPPSRPLPLPTHLSFQIRRVVDLCLADEGEDFFAEEVDPEKYVGDFLSYSLDKITGLPKEASVKSEDPMSKRYREYLGDYANNLE